MPTERLTLAQLALSKLLEIYSPMNAGRTAALEALHKGLAEYEYAVREDERAQIALGSADRSVTAEEFETILALRNGTVEVVLPTQHHGGDVPQIPAEAVTTVSGEPPLSSGEEQALHSTRLPGDTQAPSRKRK